MPVKKLGGTLSWRTAIVKWMGRCEVNIIRSRSNTSYWNKLMRVQNGVRKNESISSSCQAWCLTTSEWVNNHCYLVSFEHSVSLPHSHSNRPRLKFLGGIRSWGEFPPPKCAWIKHCSPPRPLIACRSTKRNSPPINSRCTNHRIAL